MYEYAAAVRRSVSLWWVGVWGRQTSSVKSAARRAHTCEQAEHVAAKTAKFKKKQNKNKQELVNRGQRFLRGGFFFSFLSTDEPFALLAGTVRA